MGIPEFGERGLRRGIKAGCFEALAHDLRILLRLLAGRKGQPTAVILDGRTMQSTPESGARSGYDGYKRRKGSKVHLGRGHAWASSGLAHYSRQ